MSTNDTVLLLASGASGVAPTRAALNTAVRLACTELALALCADAEGATKEIAIEVLRALKADATTAGIPVLILSNSSREEDKSVAEGLGAAGYYVKSNLSLKELAAHVERLVASARPG